jgi:phosphohistidine phosphatase
MNVFILRHGIAADFSEGNFAQDADRPLTAEGIQKLKAITRAMRAMKLEFDCILSSPYLRAKQTAEQVAEALGAQKRLSLTEALEPGGSARALIGQIQALKPNPESLLLVGHEPALSSLIARLTCGGAAHFELKKGGLCKLGIASLKAGRCAVFEWLLTPKQMSLMGC